MQIRYTRPEDLEEIHTIERANFSPEEQIAKDVLSFYLEHECKTCLVMEDEGKIAGYILTLPTGRATVTDDLFGRLEPMVGSLPYLAIVSLSVAEVYKGQGVGTLLLAAIKELAVQGDYRGISLTCKDYLLSYYGMYQFEELGISESQFGGKLWYDMYWKCP
ncbi:MULTISPECIES: GNAT family N-acetyltransferase [unclassified Streptococcus]|uniref:GNAT family N-acetyltransferase n=1 Tax=unclassified Streptococcus TaxID=2608887 RepID=UPI00107211FB|nr:MULTISPECIES: GNAT family N-acetyltransferase [unclassified Streptococcus]MBF0787615.1 GNAT family N-acetyltransferase [Streptococcus sp. 19428wC2_LYSM12]MCQ9212002.1 GNAT family N-acetyltransferase [Streptococcus sp. B01]MCQ9213331.1 GNAT family N-acetyltransferase [Streptococcus sp. O1]TFV05456.1 GNAT family N-acetyltransferase [Streptococcus sp. LYSM12]